MKVFAALARSLAKDHNIDTVFGLLGAGTMMVVDELVHRHDARCIRVAREDGAVLGAYGYQHSTGRLGVAAVGAGPALTNTLTSLVEAGRNHTPMLVIADDRWDDHGNVQGIDQASVVAPTGAGYVEIASPETAVESLSRAVEMALTERRPVVLDLPTTIAMLDVDDSIASAPVEAARGVAGESAGISGLDAALELIEKSSNPIVLAGWGAYLAGARQELDTFSERIGAPVATTMKAKSFFAGSPFNLGTFGGFSSGLTKSVVGEADLIIVFGAGLNVWTADHGALLAGKSIIQVDNQPSNVGLTFAPTVEVIGDVLEVAASLNTALESAEGFPRAFRSDALRARIAAFDPHAATFTSEHVDGTVDLHEFVSRLDRIKPTGANVVTDGGRYVTAPMRYLTVQSPNHWLAPIGGFGSIALALGASMGVSVARPEAPTFVVVGDGALMMCLYELHTAVRYSLDLVVVVMNDRAYSSEYHWYLNSDSADKELAAASLTLFDWPDFAELAKSIGFDAVTVTSIDDLEVVSAAIENRTRPLLLDVRLDPDALAGFHDASEAVPESTQPQH